MRRYRAQMFGLKAQGAKRVTEERDFLILKNQTKCIEHVEKSTSI